MQTKQLNLNPELYFDQVLNEAKDILFTAPILYQINSMSNSQLHFLFSQLYHFVELFPCFLGALLWQTDNEVIRFALIENLIDEAGGSENINSRNYNHTHARLLKTFVQQLSPAKQVAEQNIHTKILISQFNKLFVHSTFIEAMSAMACMENWSNSWFNILYSELQQRKQFSQEELYFFELHLSLDEQHGSILKEILLPLLNDTDNYQLLKNGAFTAASIWRNFYQELAQTMQLESEL